MKFTVNPPHSVMITVVLMFISEFRVLFYSTFVNEIWHHTMLFYMLLSRFVFHRIAMRGNMYINISYLLAIEKMCQSCHILITILLIYFKEAGFPVLTSFFKFFFYL